MKIINYPQYTDQFDCSIHGRILIDKTEFEAIKRLIENYTPDSSYPWRKELAFKDIGKMKNNRFNIRVTLTEYIVENMPHKGNLKRANYFFEIVKKGKN